MEEPALFGEPTFFPIGEGRLRCAETGHEVTEEDREKYASSKSCRTALLNLALLQGRPPLNYFEQHSTNKNQIVCKLTGAVVNKTETAIWKHVLGRKFNNKLNNDGSSKVDSENAADASDDTKDEDQGAVKKKSKQSCKKNLEAFVDEEPEFSRPLEKPKLKKKKKHLKISDEQSQEEEPMQEEDDVMNDIEAEIRMKPDDSVGKKKKKRRRTEV